MSEFLEILLVFGRLGLLGFGAAFSVLPEMSRQLVDVHQWMSRREFVDGYALGQLAPGPNMLAVFFFGYRINGLSGALAAGLGMFGPPLLITVVVARVWASAGHTPWADTARRALVPVGTGLMAGGVLTLARGAVHDWFTLSLAALTVFVMLRFRVNPAVAVLTGGAFGLTYALVTA